MLLPNHYTEVSTPSQASTSDVTTIKLFDVDFFEVINKFGRGPQTTLPACSLTPWLLDWMQYNISALLVVWWLAMTMDLWETTRRIAHFSFFFFSCLCGLGILFRLDNFPVMFVLASRYQPLLEESRVASGHHHLLCGLLQAGERESSHHWQHQGMCCSVCTYKVLSMCVRSRSKLKGYAQDNVQCTKGVCSGISIICT